MDIIQHAIEGIGKMLAKALFGKEQKHEIIIEQKESTANCAFVINGLVSEGKYNEAENLLFELLESTLDFELYYVGLGLYERLAALSDEELAKGNFSREEIEMGLEDLSSLILATWGEDAVAAANEEIAQDKSAALEPQGE